MNMLMPRIDTRPDTFASSSLHRHDSGTAEVWDPDSDLKQLRIPLLSTTAVSEPIDSPPRELLTEIAVNGVDPRVPIIPNKTRTAHGQLPRLNRMEDIEAFVSRQAESSECPRVPCDESPRTQNESAKGEALKAHNKEPASDVLNYFHLLERVRRPQIPYQVISLARLTLDARSHSHPEANPDRRESGSDTKA